MSCNIFSLILGFVFVFFFLTFIKEKLPGITLVHNDNDMNSY